MANRPALKLRSYGIHGSLHRWLTNYLSNRKLQAVVGGAKSQLFPVTAGVPQGSILGRTLFLVYINDAADVLPVGIPPATYAGDNNLFADNISCDGCESVQELPNWCRQSGEMGSNMARQIRTIEVPSDDHLPPPQPLANPSGTLQWLNSSRS